MVSNRYDAASYFRTLKYKAASLLLVVKDEFVLALLYCSMCKYDATLSQSIDLLLTKPLYLLVDAVGFL